jgi:hypothetical protein
MRRDITGSSQKTTLRLVLGGKEESGSALSPFGPVRAGLTTSQRTNKDLALLVLLSSLERKIEDLNTKSLEVLNTFLTDTDHPVRHISFSSTATITRNVVE